MLLDISKILILQLMGREIERKFLVSGNPEFTGKKSVSVVQAYLSVEPARTVRLRIAGDEGFITIKSSSSEGNVGRGEWEYRIPHDDALEMIDLCIPGRIEKTRYYFPYGDHTWEVDVFHGMNEGLIIAEIELNSESDVYDRPEWLGEEVTGNPDYYNSNLIK